MQNTPACTETPVQPFRPMTKADVSRVLGVCVRTIEGWVNSGEMPPPAKIGARVYWHPEVFYAWLHKRLQVAAPLPSAAVSPSDQIPHTSPERAVSRAAPKPRPVRNSSAATRALERSDRFLAALNAD